MRLWPVICALAFALLPAQATAQDVIDGGGSPSGDQYDIPLDAARGDAAPRSGGGGGAGGANGGAGEDGARKSENGFGSSSKVPGDKDGDGVSDADEAAVAAAGGGDGDSTGGGGGLKADSSPSEAGTYTLLALFVLLAGAGGALAVRAARQPSI